MQVHLAGDASWQDVWTNAWGGCAGVLWSYGRTIPRRRPRIETLAASSLVLLIAMAKPILAVGSAALERYPMQSLASDEADPLVFTKPPYRSDCPPREWAIQMDGPLFEF